jgi:hypothetical protein
VVLFIKRFNTGRLLYKTKVGSIDIVAEMSEEKISHAHDPEWAIAGKQLYCS